MKHLLDAWNYWFGKPRYGGIKFPSIAYLNAITNTELNEMNQLETNIANAVESAAPNAPIIQAAEAAISTAADPSPTILVEDLVLIHKLATEAKAALAGKHPSLMSMFHWLVTS